MKYEKITKLCTFFSILSILIACDEKIPNKDMSLAKFEITRAKSVYAEKYAPEEFKEAKSELLKCHDLVKEEKLEESKKAAVASHEKALKAYEIALPLLAKDTIEIAEKSLESADEAYAAVLAEEDYKAANDTLTKANELFELKKYYESYEMALKADRFAKEARNIALSKKNILQEAIDEVTATLEEAKKYDSDKYAAEKSNSAVENRRIAENALNELMLKKGFAAVEIAKVDADEAYLMSIKGFTEDKLSSTKDLLKQATESEGAEVAVDELEGAKESLNLAESLLAESKFKESITASEESMRLSSIVISTKKPIIVALDDKSALDEKEPEEEKKVEEEEKDYFLYKVRLIPERRDCLWRIADKFYKKGRMWKKIHKANKEKIKNPHLIWPDMMLKVPKLNKKPKKKIEETEIIPNS